MGGQELRTPPETERLKDLGVLAQPADGDLPEHLNYLVKTVDTSSLGRKEYGFDEPCARIKEKPKIELPWVTPARVPHRTSCFIVCSRETQCEAKEP